MLLFQEKERAVLLSGWWDLFLTVFSAHVMCMFIGVGLNETIPIMSRQWRIDDDDDDDDEG